MVKAVNMKERTVFLFPGQGAQYPGMGLDLLEHGGEKVKKLFTMASDISGINMVDLIGKSDPETLKRTDYSQPAITLVNLAALICLADRGIKAHGAAGFSLGEYSALTAAGVLCEEHCLFLVIKRGLAMQEAINRISSGASKPGMAAVVGLSPEQVEALIEDWKNEGLKELNAANINSPRQVVVSGSAAALEEAEWRFKKAGARRFIRLEVAGPYHSPFMREAAEEFEACLDDVAFNDPVIPLFSNVSGAQVKSGAEAKALARRHILSGVRWTDEEAAISRLEPELLIETGPGKVLQGLWKDTGSPVPCCGAGTIEEINNLAERT